MASHWYLWLFTIVSVIGFAESGAEPLELAAQSYILIDAATGSTLVEHNADTALPPASLTKMMTAYIVQNELAAGRIDLDDRVTISKKAWQMRGSLMFVEVGEKVSVENLLKGVIIVSGNDASVALAEFLAGSEQGFVDRMNATAERLGMGHSVFKNASGWPVAGHTSSARDMAVLARHIIQDHPSFYRLYNQKEFQYGTDKQTGLPLLPQANRNSLLWHRASGVDGLKTGYTQEAGYCLATSAKQDDRRLIAVVMGAKSEEERAAETDKLLAYGFRFFDNMEVFRAGVPLDRIRVWQGSQDTLPVALSEDLVLTVPKGANKRVSITSHIPKSLMAPVAAGHRVGTLTVHLDDQVIATRALIAQDGVERGHVMKRLWDQVVQYVDGFSGW